MNSGQSVQDAKPPRPAGQDDATCYATAADYGGGTPSPITPVTPVPPQVPRAQKAVQDIQDIIDKLAAVTQQLRHPHRS